MVDVKIHRTNSLTYTVVNFGLKVCLGNIKTETSFIKSWKNIKWVDETSPYAKCMYIERMHIHVSFFQLTIVSLGYRKSKGLLKMKIIFA